MAFSFRNLLGEFEACWCGPEFTGSGALEDHSRWVWRVRADLQAIFGETADQRSEPPAPRATEASSVPAGRLRSTS